MGFLTEAHHDPRTGGFYQRVAPGTKALAVGDIAIVLYTVCVCAFAQESLGGHERGRRPWPTWRSVEERECNLRVQPLF